MIPLDVLDLAQRPIDDPYWKSSHGEEYYHISGSDWLVTNEKIGPYRVRGVYRLVKEFKIEK